MLKKLATAVFGTRYDRDVKKIRPIVEGIKRHEAQLGSLSEDELRAQTPKFRTRLAERVAPIKNELEQVRQERHDCADPEERDKLEDRATRKS
jgi:preprotein translocase subunit SecA